MTPPVSGTAAANGLLSCHVCGFLVPRPFRHDARICCPRCHARLHSRKPDSIARTWALVIAAVIFYFPANLLPVTITTYLGQTQEDTIMSGVIFFIQSGSWGIALILFVASIMVPISKLLALMTLLLSIQRRSHRWPPRDRARIYRIVENIGRWSMLDVFVVTILVALVRLGYLSTMEAGPGVLYFAAVVILTMMAAMSFDPRLIWDTLETLNDTDP